MTTFIGAKCSEDTSFSLDCPFSSGAYAALALVSNRNRLVERRGSLLHASAYASAPFSISFAKRVLRNPVEVPLGKACWHARRRDRQKRHRRRERRGREEGGGRDVHRRMTTEKRSRGMNQPRPEIKGSQRRMLKTESTRLDAELHINLPPGGRDEVR